ncbi:MAG TPA: NYN domain-containing protein [Nocardioides sp.]|nr:NYN domain-containing protein [Nocardioides sp.]
MNSTRPRLAVLIDADNTSAKYVDALLDELAKYGAATVKRAYGDWTTPQLGSWKAELNKHAIGPVQQFAYTTGKNSTDSALIIDAMDLLYSGNLEAFALVSSDSDFTRLATRIRESGMTVYGLGLRKTPASLVAACDKFIYLEVLGDEPEDGDEAEPLPDLEPLLRRAVDSTSQDDGWAHLGAVGTYLTSTNTSFDPRNYGFPKLIALAQAQPFLEVENSATGSARVRLKTATRRRRSSGAAKKAAAKAAAALPEVAAVADQPGKTAAKKTTSTRTRKRSS